MRIRWLMNQRTTEGASPPMRGGPRWARTLLFGVCVLLMSTQGWSAEIKKVRVGKHAEFTRVVFELDTPAGYRIARGTSTGGAPELVVSLNAQTRVRTVKTPRSLITSVEVDSTERGSIARVQLSGSGLRLKEMILADPPRIVIDILGEPVAAPAAVTARAATPVVKPASKPVAPAPALALKPTPAALPTPVSKAAPPKPPTQTAQVAKEPEPSKPIAVLVEPKPAERSPEVAAIPAPEARKREERTQRTARAVPAPEPRSEPTRVPAAAPADSESSSFLSSSLLLGVGGVGALAIIAVVLMRRRSNKLQDAIAANEDANDPAGDDLFATLASTGSPSDDSAAADDGIGLPIDREQLAYTELEESHTESQTAEEKDEDMDMDQTELPGTGLLDGLVAAPPMAAEVSSELTGMFQALEQRVLALESQLGDSNEARDRLERQVAAQTEELRVQRAAIARTQRAVRNMTRTDEDIPTEPALRDPNQPSQSDG
jgi:hypothetical protein